MATSTSQTQDRDLSFAPANTSNPKTLNPKQVQQYNEQGFLKPFDIYNPLETQANRTYFDDLLAKLKALDDGRDSYAINGYHSRCQGIYDMATHPKILNLVQDIIGPDIICWGTHFFCKMPHDPKSIPWHQDASYWPLTPSRTVTVWLAIDDSDVENACMYVIPRTHQQGPLPWKKTDEPAVLDQKIIHIEQYDKPVPMQLKAGQISLHADMIAHGSCPNPSGRRRCGLTLRYCPPSVRVINPSWADNAIHCRGIDPTGQWGNVSRPQGDDLSIKNKPKSIGGN